MTSPFLWRRGLSQYLVILGKDYPFENRYSETAVIARVTPEKITGEGPWAARG
jgi:hypothetical protein